MKAFEGEGRGEAVVVTDYEQHGWSGGDGDHPKSRYGYDRTCSALTWTCCTYLGIISATYSPNAASWL